MRCDQTIGCRIQCSGEHGCVKSGKLSKARGLTRGAIQKCDNGSMELLVYSANWCRDCREAKRFLAKHAIPYREVDIEHEPGAAETLVAATGKRAIPQFVLDGRWIQPYKPGQGFLHEEMAELFGVSPR